MGKMAKASLRERQSYHEDLELVSFLQDVEARLLTKTHRALPLDRFLGSLERHSVLSATVSGSADKARWDFTIVEDHNRLSISIALPTGATPAELDLDISSLKVVARCTGLENTALHPLDITLPRLVNPVLAPPATFKKKERRILLELPFADI